MTRTLDDIRRVVSGATHAPRGKGDAPHVAGGDGQRLLQLLGVAGGVRGVRGVGGVRRGVRRRCCSGRPDCLQQRLWRDEGLVEIL